MAFPDFSCLGRWGNPWAAFILGLALVGPAAAFPQTSVADSVHALAMEQRVRIAQADSLGDGTVALESRLLLAGLTSTKEARILLQEAAALADSMDRPDFGATAHRHLAALLARSGNLGGAYAQLLTADSLERYNSLREYTRMENEEAAVQGTLIAERDSIKLAAEGRESRMAKALYDLQLRSDAWMYSTWAAMGVGLLLVIGLVFHLGKTARRQREAIAALRKEVEELRNRGNRRKDPPETGAATAPDAALTTSEIPPPSVDVAMQPVVSGLFRKDGPERLTTLQDARARGDNEKVLRVVATLKPQLLGFDAERYRPLIARLKAPDAASDARRWNADLDNLEDAIKKLLARPGH